MINKSQIALVKVSAIFCLIFLYQVEGKDCNFNIKVAQKLLNEGFHRNLSYNIDFASSNKEERQLYEDCMVGVEQTLPAGLYSTLEDIKKNGCKSLSSYYGQPHEIRRYLLVYKKYLITDFQNSNNDFKKEEIRTIFKTPVNIELPEKKAKPVVIHLLSKVRRHYRNHIYIPVHARYQHAGEGGGTIRNEIPKPYLYLLCPNNRLQECDDVSSRVSLQDRSHFCAEFTDRAQCLWKEIPIVMVTAPLVWEVPLGNTNHWWVVTCGTCAVVAAGSLYLLKTLHQYRRQI